RTLMIKKVRDYGNREKEKELALIPMSQKDLTCGTMPKSTITYWQRWWTPYGWYNRPRTWKEISRETYMSLLSFRKVSETNLDRALVWHPKGLEEWSPLEWGGALAGEAGELCNILKKLKRLDTGLQQADNVTKSELLNK